MSQTVYKRHNKNMISSITNNSSPVSCFKKFKLNRKTSFLRFKDNSLKRVAVLYKKSFLSHNKTKKLISSISNTYSHMCIRYNKDEKIHSNLRNVALNQTKQLKTEINKINKINREINLFYHENYTGEVNKISPPKEIIVNDHNLSYDDISIVSYEDIRSGNLNKKIENYFQKKQTLNKLKGEILMREQKLKFNVNETFEKPRTMKSGDFVRNKYYNNIKFERKINYNKNNLINKKLYKLHSQNQSHITNKELRRNRPNSNYSFLSTSNNYFKSIQNTSSNIHSGNINNISSNTTQSSLINPKKQKRIVSPISCGKSYKMKSFDFDNNITNNEPIYTHTHYQQTENKGKYFLNHKDICDLVKNMHVTLYNKGKNISNRIIKSMNYNKNINNDKTNHKKSKSEFDLNAIIKEFNLNMSSRFIPIDEKQILKSKANKVGKYLCKDSRLILDEVVKQLMNEKEYLNNNYFNNNIENNLTISQLRKIRLEKEFRKVCNQTMALKKHLNVKKSVEPINEKEKIDKIMKQLNSTSWEDNNNFEHIILKAKVMKKIKPLILCNKNANY